MEFDNLLKLIKTMSDSKLAELRYEENGVKIRMAKNQGNVEIIRDEKIDFSLQESEEEPAGEIVKSPLVGNFYAAPAEGAKPYVAVGDVVKKGQVLAIVEAMKLMNEIESDCDGTIAEIYVKDGEAVEYGQPLFCIV